MRRHELKILPKWYENVESNKKNFEIRRNDRDFKVGDTLVLQEYEEGSYTGRQITRKIQYIYQGNGDYGLSEGYCILGLEQEPICIAKVEFDEDKLQEIVKEQVARIEITTEQEPSGDLISRQAVIDLIEHYNSDGLGSVFYGYENGVKFADAVNKLPSVNPQEPKTGHWKPYLKEGLTDMCSECGSRFDRPWNYCPHCGAKMENEGSE